jgi:hypothetical protein
VIAAAATTVRTSTNYEPSGLESPEFSKKKFSRFEAPASPIATKTTIAATAITKPTTNEIVLLIPFTKHTFDPR